MLVLEFGHLNIDSMEKVNLLSSEQNVENLRYLSSEQYLADVANFIRTQNQNLNLSNPKWVVFGGSYSGSLALWFRQLYPDIAIGAVGSSAPIQPVLDFYEYDQVVENSIKHRDPKCAKNIKIAFKQLEAYMEYNEGRDDLNKIFNIRYRILLIPINHLFCGFYAFWLIHN
uniref:Uncharacterized protein n=1 Tax=Panagrolaimus davidi TaxID=227884 RepID=A0A914Q1W5_9BILA